MNEKNVKDNKKKGLGKGLGALLGNKEEKKANRETNVSQKDEINSIINVKLEELKPSPYQPRMDFDESAIADLIESVREKGILQPLLVRKKDGHYEIIAGERRFRAAGKVGLSEVPVIVKDFTDRETLEVALIENLQRQDLSPLEEAEGYQRLMTEFSHTQEALAKSIGKSRSHVANSIRLLTLPEQVKQYLIDGLISAGHARAILSVPQTDIISFTKEIVKKGLNVRQAEKLSKNFGAKIRKQETPKKEKDSDIIELEQEISKMLGMKINISSKETGGILSIHYNNLEQLDQIIKSLASNKEHFEALPIKNNDIIEEDLPASEITENSELESIDDDVMIETSEVAAEEKIETQTDSFPETEIETELEGTSTEKFEIPEESGEKLDIQTEEDNEKLESSLEIETEETIEPDENISKEALDMLEQEIEAEPESGTEEDMIDIDEMMEDVVKQIKESE